MDKSVIYPINPRDLAEERKATGQPVSTWDALKEAAPEIAEVMETLGEDAVLARRRSRETYDTFPGFRHWLLLNFALNIPSRTIRTDLAAIVEDQKADGLLLTWPILSKRTIESLRHQTRDEWLPIEARLTSQIENVGVLAKNRRLLALARMAERLEEVMWEERNGKTGELYLHNEYRQVLRQIAEEKGELGETEESAVDALGQVALALVDALKVQGSGVATIGQTDDFDYDAVKNVDVEKIEAEWRELAEEG